MNKLLTIPELQALDSRRSLIRIPNELDIPITDRVRQLIDSAAFQRLSRISQLGLVSLVYPAANHTRFEHSLGVYRNALLYLKHLGHLPRFADAVSEQDAVVLIVAALLHDVGHWAFCHPIEDMKLDGISSHEQFAQHYLLDSEIATLLRRDWSVEPEDVLDLLAKKRKSPADRILTSIMSGPVDIDKMDYLYRDSLHAGVPYGKNFDQQRLIGSLVLNQAGDGIAISEKGKTAAEMMVFARYVMFSEVYWHHAVRSATAMIQRAFYAVKDQVDCDRMFLLTESEMVVHLQSLLSKSPAQSLGDGLFGTRRLLYKRLAQFSYMENSSLYDRIARQPFDWLVKCSEALALRLGKELHTTVSPYDVLFDAPPVKLEVEFNVDVYFAREDSFRKLSEVSPVVQTLARQQFDDYVKRVRVFVHPRVMDGIRKSKLDIAAMIDEEICGI